MFCVVWWYAEKRAALSYGWLFVQTAPSGHHSQSLIVYEYWKRLGLVTWGLYVLPSSRHYRRVQVLIDATYSYDIDTDDKLTGTSQTSKLHFYFCLLSMPNPANPNGPAIPTTTNPVDAYARLVSTRFGAGARFAGTRLVSTRCACPQSAFSMPVAVCAFVDSYLRVPTSGGFFDEGFALLKPTVSGVYTIAITLTDGVSRVVCRRVSFVCRGITGAC